MKRPRIKIESGITEYLLEGIALTALIALIIIPYNYYAELSETIPSHFDYRGNPDAYSGKGIIWMLPFVGILMYLLLSIIIRHPHNFNYPVPITESNAATQYTLATRMLNAMKAILSIALAYLTYSQVQIATDESQGLNSWFIPLFLIALMFPVFIYFKKAKK